MGPRGNGHLVVSREQFRHRSIRRSATDSWSRGNRDGVREDHPVQRPRRHTTAAAPHTRVRPRRGSSQSVTVRQLPRATLVGSPVEVDRFATVTTPRVVPTNIRWVRQLTLPDASRQHAAGAPYADSAPAPTSGPPTSPTTGRPDPAPTPPSKPPASSPSTSRRSRAESRRQTPPGDHTPSPHPRQLPTAHHPRLEHASPIFPPPPPGVVVRRPPAAPGPIARHAVVRGRRDADTVATLIGQGVPRTGGRGGSSHSAWSRRPRGRVRPAAPNTAARRADGPASRGEGGGTASFIQRVIARPPLRGSVGALTSELLRQHPPIR